MKMNRLFLLGGIAAVLLGALLVIQIPVPQNSPSVSSTPTVAQAVRPVTYQGQKGKNALELLQAQTATEQDASGLVTTINGKKADASNHEFWTFYVNGKIASIGPAQYVTKDTDTIEWKIENY